MLKKINVLLLILLPLLMQGQDFVCGYIEECNCARTGVESSFETGDIIIEGKVLSVDTLGVERIIILDAKWFIENHLDTIAHCAKTVLKKEKVIVVEIEVNEILKGDFEKRKIKICTPFEKKNCAYVGFEKGERFIVYGSVNETADSFFTYSLEEDFFILKNEYKYWTNYCRRTSKTRTAELGILRKLNRQ